MSTQDATIDAGAVSAAYHARAGERRMFLVVHVDGPEPRRSWVVELPDGGELTIGRSRGATIAVDHDKVSRLHASIVRAGDAVTVDDLESRNGTWVNGRRITGPTPLVPGDELVVGPATAVVGATTGPSRRSRIADAEAFAGRLAGEVDRAVRYQRRVAVAMLRVVGDDAVPEAIGRAIRAMDVLAEYAPEHYALVLPELGRDEATATVKQLVDAARGLGTEIRAGLAVAPDDAVSADALIDLARGALRRAEPGGIAVAAAPAEVMPDDAVVLDPAMKRVYTMVERIADASLTVLVLGETGVGKELVAEAIHRRSSRHDGPLVKLNCASLPETLLESELFGHERGAFTGAERRKIGFFEAAHGGTLFLDEIGEMQPGLQAKMLRALERKVVTRVGATEELRVDVRVVAATHRDLEAEVRAGRFRDDLYFRIAGFTVVVPPLRDRRIEIVPLAEHFLRALAADQGQPAPPIAPDAAVALERYDWPGNVRELRNAVERALVVRAGPAITADDLPERVQDASAAAAVAAGAGTAARSMRARLAELELAAISDALERSDGNQTRAARLLGISRRALIYKMERLGLKPPPASTKS